MPKPGISIILVYMFGLVYTRRWTSNKTTQCTKAKYTHTQSRVEEVNKARLNLCPTVETIQLRFKVFLMTIKKAVVGKVNNMYEQMENYSRGTEAIRKIKWKYWEIFQPHDNRDEQ